MKNQKHLARLILAVVAAWVSLPASACAQASAADRTDASSSDTASFRTSVASVRLAAASALESAVLSLSGSARMHGASGSVHATVLNPGEELPLTVDLPRGMEILYVASGVALPRDTIPGTPGQPGAWDVLLRMGDVTKRVPDLRVFTSLPLASGQKGRIGKYLVGSWPDEKSGSYAPPAGLVEVTEDNADLRVSEHVRLRDYLTKGQNDVWPKYVVLDARVLDKLELTIDELESAGHEIEHVGVISAFRPPWYNANGGSTAGRGQLSRHMYGDAIDVYVDNDRNGQMDDLNGDGRVDRKDTGILASAAERVERDQPHLVGGIGIYTARPGAHSGFVHIDARGTQARW